MTKRRQALNAGEPAATDFLLALIPIFIFTPPNILAASVLAKADPASSAAVLLTLMSAFTLFICHRRDVTSPRRVGRRI